MKNEWNQEKFKYLIRNGEGQISFFFFLSHFENTSVEETGHCVSGACPLLGLEDIMKQKKEKLLRANQSVVILGNLLLESTW